ncbi:MAG: hypothetical protein LBK82_08990 [Planctomycetaceae bacterium]|jgi:hypothetical protein|nr:hypothetical protein [Planctomycetaceae bacterium]
MKFEDQLKNAFEKATKNAHRRVVRAALKGFEKINEWSPVDQGTFRANWNVSFGELDRSFDLDLTKDDIATNTATAMAKITNDTKLGTTVYISNSVPYAIPLENGHSWQQAPHGIVAPTLRFLQNAIDAGRLK